MTLPHLPLDIIVPEWALGRRGAIAIVRNASSNKIESRLHYKVKTTDIF